MKKIGFMIAAILMMSCYAQAFQYVLSKGPSDKTFQKNVQILLQQAEALLPASIKQSFKKPVEVRFESLKEHGDHALGKLAWGSIRIDLKAVPEILRGERNATPTQRTHKTFYREILATVVHETIHAYDRLNEHDAEEARMIRQCKDEKETQGNNRTSPECRPYENMYRSYSQNPYFTMIADPDYACRRPSLYHLFRTKFNHTPYPNSHCQVPLNYVIPDFKGKNSPLRSIDPNRIYQIHYLLAGEGKAMMSGWGHSMFRIVMCAPDRKSVGPDCLKDLNDHIVLSYRAFVNSIQINTLKGLTGDYPSRLFLVPMNQVIEEYTKTELRDLRSIPMNLSRDEIRQFVIRAIETHWSYDGKYYFTSNNCAVESLNLMKGSLFRPGLIDVSIKTPMGLEKELQRLKITDNRMFSNRLQAINNGYLFDSYKDRYEMSFVDIYSEVEKNVESLINSAQLKEIEAINANVQFALKFMRSL